MLRHGSRVPNPADARQYGASQVIGGIAIPGSGKGVDTGTRGELVDRLVESIEAVTVSHPLRVSIDGPPAAGKTMLADELAVRLRRQGRDVIRASIEDFLFPRSRRYRRGEYSGDSCYYDSFDYEALHRVLIAPLGPGGDRRFQQAVYDHHTDSTVARPATTSPADAVLLLDGVFLLRPELIGWWDLRIFVSASFERTVDRARTRDLATLGSVGAVEHRFRTRYIPAQEIYFAAAHPTDQADIVVHNDEPLQPAWVVRLPRAGDRSS